MARAPGRKDEIPILTPRLAEAVREMMAHCGCCSLVLFRPLSLLPQERARSGEEPRYTLTPLAERLRSLIRRTDDVIVAPQEALALVLGDAPAEGARAALQRLCAAIELPPPLVTPLAAPPHTKHTQGFTRRDATHDTRVRIRLGAGYSTLDERDACDEMTIEAAIRTARKTRGIIAVALPAAAPDALSAPPVRASARRISRRALPLEAVSLTQPSGAGIPCHAGAARQQTSQASPQLQLVPPSVTSTARAEIQALREQAEALGVPFLRLPARLPSGCRRAISGELARELAAVPVGRGRGTLTVAMANPRDAAALARLRDVTGMHIFPVLTATEDLERALRLLSG